VHLTAGTPSSCFRTLTVCRRPIGDGLTCSAQLLTKGDCRTLLRRDLGSVSPHSGLEFRGLQVSLRPSADDRFDDRRSVIC
jgi:hypothetical protein